MTPWWWTLSLLVLALEESGIPILVSDNGWFYLPCPWTRWHADVDIKHAYLCQSPGSLVIDVLHCEICGQRTASQVFLILPTNALRRALDRHDAVVKAILATSPGGVGKAGAGE